MGIHLDRARILLFDQSRPELAEKELRQELAADPNCGLTHAMLAHALGRQGKLEPGLTEVKEAIRLSPDMAYAHSVLSWLFSESGQMVLAVPAIREAIRLDPNNPSFFSHLSFTLCCLGHHVTALKAANEGLQLNPQDVSCLNRRASALTQLGRVKEAQATLDIALALQPMSDDTHTNLGWFHYRRNDLDNAVGCLQESLRIAPNDKYTKDLHLQALRKQLGNIHFFSGCILAMLMLLAMIGLVRACGFQSLDLFVGIFGFGGVCFAAIHVAFNMCITNDSSEEYLVRLDRFWRLPLLRRLVLLWRACLGGLLVGLTANSLWIYTNSKLAALAFLFGGMALWTNRAMIRLPPGEPRKFFVGYSCWMTFIGAGALLLCASTPGAMHPLQAGIGAMTCHIFGIYNLALFQIMAGASPNDPASIASS